MRIKKILSLILSAVLALSASITAFSTESVAEFLGDEYTYAGELSEGWNIVCEKVAGKYVYAYYSVKVENDGYYKVVYGDDTNSMSAYILLDISDNYKKIHGEDLFWNEYTYKSVYHLEKGEYILVVDVYSALYSAEVYFEYMGESITDISFDHEQILDYDFDYYNDGHFNSYADATITFSSGKTVEYTDGMLSGKMKSDYVDGKNEVIISFIDKEYPSTATVYPASHYISDVELSNAEYYMENTIEYYCDIDAVYPYGETVTVTFTDGTTLTEEFDGMIYITLPNGQNYELNIDFYFVPTKNRQKCCMEICLEYITLKEYWFSGKKVSLGENLDKLKESNSELFKILKEELEFVFEYGEPDDKLEAFIAYPTMIFLNVIMHFLFFFNYYATLSFI